jgi:DNA methylase
VALVERAIRNSSKTRDIVLDPFGGSGSTLIACEKAGRHARLIACFASSWTAAMVRRWHADPFGFLRPWGEVPALIASAPPATPHSTGTGVVTFQMR